VYGGWVGVDESFIGMIGCVRKRQRHSGWSEGEGIGSERKEEEHVGLDALTMMEFRRSGR